MEKEKVVILTSTSLLIVKYNFIRMSVVEMRRLMLKTIEYLHIGDFVYPSFSVMP